MDTGYVIPQPTGAQARDDFDRVRQAFLVNVRLLVNVGAPADDILEEIDATRNAARQIVELLK